MSDIISGSKGEKQIDALASVSKTESPRLVTVTAGGDDLKFAWVLGACYASGHCSDALLADIAFLTIRRSSFVDRLADLYTRIAAATGGQSKVVAVGYPEIMPEPSSAFTAAFHCPWLLRDGFGALGVLSLFYLAEQDLNSTIAAAASKAGVQFVPILQSLHGHELCTGKSWINNLSFVGGDERGHPTPQGQQAMATAVLGQLGSLLNSSAMSRAASPSPVTTSPFVGSAGAKLSAGFLSIDTTGVTRASVGVPYVGLLGATGGTDPYTWTITSGALPSGFTLDPSTGIISGEHDTPGSFSFTVKASDSSTPTPQTASANVTLTVSAPPTLSMATTDIPAGTVGQTYRSSLQSRGGLNPITWSVTSGSLPNGLTLDPSSGAISGVPSAAGNYSVTVRATDSSVPSVQTVSVALSISIVNASSSLAITSPSIPNAQQGAYYSSSLTSTGGTAPVTWSITSGALPPGLGLDFGSGAITGIPTSSGTFTFVAAAVDRSAPRAKANVNLTLTVTAASAPSVLTTALPDATQGRPYQFTLNAVGGVIPYSWSIISGSLPTGLALDSTTGTISGTPTESGSFSISVDLSDGSTPSPQFTRQDLSITVAASPPLTVAQSLPQATVGQSYVGNVAVTGGVSPYTWALTAGSLPSGLSLDPGSGTITGVPTQSGNFPITVQVSDSSAPSAQAATTNLSIAVNPPPPLSITATSLPDAVVGSPYRAVIGFVGGTAPYTWSLTSGALPAGLNIDPATGVVSGTPTSVSTSSFTARVSDSSSPTPESATATISLAVVSPPALPITTTQLANGTMGSNYLDNLVAGGGTAPYTWSLTAGALPDGLSLTTNTGGISGIPTSSGSSSFTVQVTDNSTPNAQTATLALSITVDPAPPVRITTSALDGGTQGASYSQQLDAGGGVTPFAWSVTSGSLPPGLSLDQSGTISGEPTSGGGIYPFTVRVTDSSTPTPQSDSVTLSIDVEPAPPLAIATASLPAGTQGVYYSNVIAVSGGAGPYVFSIVSGALPTGLSLDPQSGLLFGEITSSQGTTFTISVADSTTPTSQKKSRTFSLTVTAAPP